MCSTRAVDRRALGEAHAEKRSRWPRTARRQERVRDVLAKRQPDLTVVLENVHDPHNVSAILRSADAVGVLRVHTVYTIEEAPQGAFSRETSASAAKWVEVERHATVGECFRQLRDSGFSVLVTALAPTAPGLYEWDLTRPVAIVIGNEMRGVSEEAVALADGVVEIPMAGMVQSLNVSVACAVCLYEAYRQRTVAGAYDHPKLAVEVLEALENDWLRR